MDSILHLTDILNKVRCPRRTLPNGLNLLVSRAELSDQFKLFGKKLARWCDSQHRIGREVTFIPIMHGAAFAWQRLMGHIGEESPHKERIIVAQSYGDGQTAVPVKIHADWIVPERDIRGRAIVLIDDVLDSGDTMEAAVRYIDQYGPASIDTFFMVRKARPRNTTFDTTWVMIDLDDVWLIGAGLDDAGKRRHLRYIAEKPRRLSARPMLQLVNRRP